MSVDVSTLSIEVRSDGVLVATNRLDHLAKSGKTAEESTTSLSSSMSKVSGYVAAAAAAFSAWKLSEYIKDATMLAARVETLGVVMRVVGANAGYTSSQMDAFTTGLKKMGITTQESMSSLIKMSGAQMDLTKASQLARVAQDAAVIGGINSSEAFGRMIQGIRSGEVEILKTIGINVQFEQGYKQMAATLGKTSEQLTSTEKTASRMNQVLAFGTNIAGAYEASMSTAGKQMLSMARYTEELKLKIGALFTPALTFAVAEVTRALKNMDEQMAANAGTVDTFGQGFKESLVSIAAEVQRVSMVIDLAGGTLTAFASRAMKIAEVTTRFMTIGQFGDWFKKKSEALARGNAEYAARYAAGEKELQRLADSLTNGAQGSASPQDQAREKAAIAASAAQKAKEAAEAQKSAAEAGKQAAEQWRSTYADLRAEIDGLNPAMDEYARKIANVTNEYAALIGKKGANVALLQKMKSEMISALTAQRDLVAVQERSTEAARFAVEATKDRLEEERSIARAVERQVQLTRELADLQARNKADSAQLTADQSAGKGFGFSSINDQLAADKAAIAAKYDAERAGIQARMDQLGIEKDYELGLISEKHAARMAAIEAENKAAYFDKPEKLAAAAAAQASAEKEYQAKISAIKVSSAANTAGILAGLNKALTLTYGKQTQENLSAEDKATRAKLSLAANYTGAASDMFTLLASTQDESSRSGFESAKAYSMAAAIMNTAAGIMNAFASLPWPAAPIAAALVAATGVVQIAKISSTEFGGGAGSVATPASGSFNTSGASGAGGGVGSARGADYTSSADNQSLAAMQRLAESVDNASVAMRKVSDGLTTFAGMLSGDSAQMAIGGVNGRYTGLNPDGNYHAQYLKNVFTAGGNYLGLDAKSTLGALKNVFFGSGKWTTTASGVELGISDGDLEGQGYTVRTKKGGLFTSTKNRTTYDDLSAGFENMLQKAIAAITSQVNLGSAILGTGNGIAGLDIPTARIATAGRKPEDIQKDVESWLQMVGNEFAKTVRGLAALAAPGEEAYSALIRLATALQGVNEYFELIGKTLFDSSLTGANQASKLVELMGGNESFSRTMEEYFTGGMFTEAQQEAALAAQATLRVSTAFRELNMTVPSSRAGFIDLVNSLDTTTESGAAAFQSLMNIQGAFVTMTEAADEAARRLTEVYLDSAMGAATSLRDIMGGSLSTLTPQQKLMQQQASFAQALASGNTSRLGDMGRELLTTAQMMYGSGSGYTNEYNNVTSALASVAGITGPLSLDSVDRQIYAIETVQTAINDGTKAMVASIAELKAEIAALRKQTDDSIAATKQGADTVVDAVVGTFAAVARA